MSLTYQEKNDRVTNVLDDGQRVAVITERNGQVGFRIFGERISGSVDSRDEAREALEEHFH